jgi:hypothetical protein
VTEINSDVVRRVRVTGYVLSALFVLLPWGEIASSAWPWFPGQPLWRFSVAGMLGASTATMLIGLLVAFLIASVAGDPKVNATISVVASLFALICLVNAGMFGLDALQLRSNVTAQDPGKFYATSGWIVAKLVVSTLAFTLVAVMTGRAAADSRRDGARTGAAARSGVLVGAAAPGRSGG